MLYLFVALILPNQQKKHRKAEQRFVSRCRKLLTTPMGKVRKKLCDQLLSVGVGSKKWFYFLEVCDILDERCVTLNFSIWKKVFYIVSWYFKPIFFECPWQEKKIWLQKYWKKVQSKRKHSNFLFNEEVSLPKSIISKLAFKSVL